MSTQARGAHLSPLKWSFYWLLSSLLIVSLPVTLLILTFLEPTPGEEPNLFDIPPWLYQTIRICAGAIVSAVAAYCVTNWSSRRRSGS